MRHRLPTIGILLLTMAVILGVVTGCERRAESREPQPSGEQAAETTETASDAATTAPSSATVVSVIPADETSAAPAPAATEIQAAPGAETVPTDEAESQAASETSVEVVAPAETEEVTVVEDDTPEPTSAPAGSSGQAARFHTVKRGETLSSIARRYGTTSGKIARENNIKNPNRIYVGQKLTLPGGGESSSSGGSSGSKKCSARHTVKRGEWIYQIARNYGVSAAKLMSVNGLTVRSANLIYPGKVLCIP